MEKEEFKLGFIDTFGAIENYFTTILSHRYKVVRDDKDPDYLIFGDRNFGNKNLSYQNPELVRIFYTGENERPSNYMCDHSISFDHDDDDRNYRLPLYAIYDFDNRARNVPNAGTVHRGASDLAEPKKFCSFIVKNGACEKRNKFFHWLNEYEPVASAGPLFNNTGPILERGENSVKSKMEFLPKFKFNLCFENASHPGYCTEKIYEALCGRTVPIYWGSPTVELDFNSKAFLNWHDYQDDALFFQAIRRINEDNDLYQEMYLQPMFPAWESNVPGFKQNKFMDPTRFLRWWGKNVMKND
jgi:hypothetical protein